MTLDEAVERTTDLARALHQAEKDFKAAAVSSDEAEAAGLRELAHALLEARAELVAVLLGGKRSSP